MLMNKLKRCISTLLMIVFVLSTCFENVVYSLNLESEVSLNDLLLYYEFNETSATSGTIIKDSSGNGNDGVLNGSGAEVSDGVLTLPGGNANSNAAYVEMPKGLFDSKDTLTISVWLKNETGAGNYSAMFFGTMESLPTQYWLLNPSAPNGCFKSVFTNSVNVSQPWSTEKGISSGQKTDNSWALFTTVITPKTDSNNGELKAYYNGKYIGGDVLTRNVSDFGKNLVAYIGRSSYSDIFYKGKVKEVKVYNKELSDEEIKEDYFNLASEEAINNALLEDSNALNIENRNIIEDISLPQKGSINYSKITWTSSNEEYISNSGVVNRPEDSDKEVSLKATLTLGVKNIDKTFNLTVLSSNIQNDLNEVVRNFNLNAGYVDKDFILPNTAGKDSKVNWTSSNEDYITNEGKVTRPTVGEGNKEITLKAEIELNGVKATKEFLVTVIEEYYGYLMSYTKSDNGVLDNSLHLGYSIDGSNFTALNSNSGILFAKNTSTTKNDNKNGLKSPFIFRKNNGTYGIIATNNDSSPYVYIYESEDLINFYNETKITLNNSNIKVLSPQCYYDNSTGDYIINWADGNNKYKNTTKDFINISQPIEEEYEVLGKNDSAVLPDKAINGNIIQVTKDEYFKVVNKLGVISNTGIEEVNINISNNEELNLPELVTGNYSDGSTASLSVEWSQEDIDKINFSKPGVYTVNGSVSRKEYENPFIEEKADPWITKGSDGYYYFTASYPMYGSSDKNGYSKVTLRRSETIEGLMESEEITIWDSKNSSKIFRYIWAPEIHEINGVWYVYFTGSTSSSNVWGIKPHVLQCTGNNPMNPNSWVEKGVFQTTEGDSFSFKDFSLDMTYFESNGEHYVIWAQKGVASDLYMATINPDEPWKLISKPMLLTTPEYAWERIYENVNEGPAVIKRNGKVFVYYSASATGVEYCMGVLSADENSDLMKQESWSKNPYPVLTSNDVPGEYGPGHNSFTIDENGNDVFVYHARSEECYEDKCDYASESPLYDPCRHARVRNVHWAADGTPILKMTSDQAVSSENKNIEATITVEGVVEESSNILHYDMTIENGTLVDKSGNKNGSIKNLKDEDVKDGRLVFNNDSDPLYVEIPDGTVNGLKDITISAIVNWKGGVNASWLYTLGSDSGKYLFVTPSNNSSKLQSGFAYGSNLNGWQTEKAASHTTKLTSNEWSMVTITFDSDNNTLSLYLNENLVGENKNISYELEDILKSGSVNGYIGKSFYSADPYFSGELADFKIFNKALNSEEIMELNDESDDLILNLSVSSVEYETILNGNKDKDNIVSDLKLPTSIGAVSIEWESSDESVISKEGKVIASTENKDVVLKAKFKYANKSIEKTFNFTVLREMTALEKLNYDKDLLIINNIDDVRGNLTLLTNGYYGSNITWTSSDESIIASKDNGDIKAGVVTRQDDDVEVKLVATLTLDNEIVTKEFTAKVKAKVKNLDYKGYIFTYFIGENFANGEQIYLGASKDGLNWEELNDNKPILTSDLGEKGVRDPFIIRSPEGDKFYLIATDLKIYNGNGWGAAQSSGSQSIMVWESTDLVNWSNQRMVEVAIDTAGCTWAPEAVYDKTTGEYVVFWASKDNDRPDSNGNYHHRIYYAKTRDFYTFTEPELYYSIELDNNSATDVIDTTIIEDNGTYYRFTKNEVTKKVFLEKSDAIFGTWTKVDSNVTGFNGVEGPTIFKFNDRDEWCLLLDEYSGIKYYPSVTDSLEGGQFVKLDTSEYSLPKGASPYGPRHGTVLSVTQEEYDNIMKAYGDGSYVAKYNLEIEVSEARKITDEDLENVIPSVVREFREVLENAESILVDEASTQEQVDIATEDLKTIMMKLLSSLKGDKSDLIELANKVESLEEDKYFLEEWNKLQSKLENAKIVINDDNVLEEDVNKAYTALLEAYLNLKPRPNKEALINLINSAKAIDSSKYTKESFEVLKEALALAEEVLNNEEATEEEVHNAEDILNEAISNLKEDDSNNPGNGDDDNGNNNNGNNNGNNGNGNNNGNNSSNSNNDGNNNNSNNVSNNNKNNNLPSTGGRNTSLIFLGAVLVIGVGVLFIKREKVKREQDK
ncbi:immunoglobulin-like domain-containing protein [Clostridium nigeriense]|uniref:immunoglobulin-like domain-containing protein n=1 Tax=Clostridium nigeriense TaxID=1805470 RepID=UPI003D33BAE9